MSNLLPNRRKRRVVPVRNETHTVPSSGWELYNLRTENIDQELIKEWNDNLTNLLIFAALYSAILAGFVIESMKKLEEDPQETTRDLLIYLVNQTSNAAWNQTVERFVTTPFSPENHAVVVSALLFASLSLGLVVGLIAIIILQWIIRYDSGLLRKKAQDRAATRQYRWEGIQRWRLPEMIGLLPLLLYLSFSLFFAGLVLWLFHVNKFVFWTTLSIFCLGILFYLGTTTLAVIFNHAPFDTPLSDGLSRLIIRKKQEDREKDAVSNDTDLEIRVLMDQLDTLEWRIHLLPDLSKTLGSFLRLKKPQTLPSQEMFQTRQVKWTKMFRQTIDHFAQMDNDQEQDVEIFSESAAILRYSTLKPTGYFDSNGVSETVVEGLIKSSNLICNEDANNSLPSDHESKTFFFHVALQKQYYMSFYDPQCSTVLENLSHILDLLPTHETISGTLIRDISTITTSAILGIHGKQRSPGLYLPQLPYNVILDGDIPEYREQAVLWKNAVERLYAALYPIRPPRSWKALTWYPLRLLTDLSLTDTQTINSEDRGRIIQILRRIFSNACMKLRESDANSWENVLSDIALLLLPNVQKEFEYIMLPELLVASVQLGTVSGVGADKVREKIQEAVIPFLQASCSRNELSLWEEALQKCLIPGSRAPSHLVLSLVKWHDNPNPTKPQEEDSELFRQVKGLIALDPLRQGQLKEDEASKDVIHERELTNRSPWSAGPRNHCDRCAFFIPL